MSDTETPTTTLADLKTVADLPQWAQDEISEARAEAAKYRTEKKDAVEAAKGEVEGTYKSKVEELEAQLASKDAEVDSSRTEVVKLKAALEAGIDSDKVMSFASLLKGDTEDELKSHAAEVKELFGSTSEAPKKDPAHDPSQGSGNHKPLNGDPLLEAVMGIVNK